MKRRNNINYLRMHYYMGILDTVGNVASHDAA
jgi:hypothetical protein